MDSSNSATKQKLNGVLRTVDLTVYVLSWLEPYDAWWALKVCRFWWLNLRNDESLRAQVWRNYRTEKRSCRNCFDVCTLSLCEKASIAAARNYRDHIEWILARKVFVTFPILACIAISRNNVSLFIWLVEKRPSSIVWSDVCYKAIEWDNLAILKYLEENHVTLTTATLNEALLCNSFEVVRWMHEDLGIPFDDTSCDNATISDNVLLLQYCVMNGAKFNMAECLNHSKPNSATRL